MNFLPDTTRDKGRDRRPSSPVLVAVCIVLLFLAGVLFLMPGDFSPGEALISPGAEDIAASSEDTTYPSSDRLRFGDGTEVVYVYLRVEDLPTQGDLEARVERTSRTSAIGRIFGSSHLRVVDEDEERLGVSGGGVTGVVKFAVRAEPGRRLPAGNYTVGIYAPGPARSTSTTVARKYFVVGD
ncbi:MAG TPA: hypothetical protein VJ827_14185 [Rubrobacter sp.]|nr:hypothetical protein [Rubrobacter sp.]